MADTAKLLASLDLQDAMSPKLKSAMGNVSAAEARVGSLGSRLTAFSSTLKNNVGSALTTFGGRMKQAALGIAAFAGVGGLLGLGAALKSALSEASSFGSEVIRLTAVTRLSASQASDLAAVFNHFGVDADTAQRIVGMASKNLDALAGTSAKAAKFMKDYGLSLTDAKGHVIDLNTLLLRSTDYFNKHANTTERNAALAKIFGRNWQELVPILSSGAAGIRAVEAEARAAGLTLTAENLVAVKKNIDATRNWNTALEGLKLQIGVGLLPNLTELATTATTFVTSHRADIAAFFKNAADAAKTAAGTIAGFVGTVSSFWNSIPAPFRDLLVRGIVADRTVKFLFGFSPIHALLGGATSGIGSLLGTILSKTPLGRVLGGAGVPHVWVDNLGPGGLGGGLPGGLPAAGLGLLGGGLALLGVAGALFVAAEGIRRVINPNSSGNPIQSRTAAMDAAHLAGQFAPPQAPVVGSANIGHDPETRQILSNAAYWSAKTAARTEGVRIAIAASAQKSATAAELAHRIAQRTADKVGDIRETNRILRQQKTSFSTHLVVNVGVRTGEGSGTTNRYTTQTQVVRNTIVNS